MIINFTPTKYLVYNIQYYYKLTKLDVIVMLKYKIEDGNKCYLFKKVRTNIIFKAAKNNNLLPNEKQLVYTLLIHT